MAGKRMRTLQYDCYGGRADALKLIEIPIPLPKESEVLIKVEAASLNPADWKIQEGILRPYLPVKFPFRPGTDVAGVVIEVGSGVQTFKPGDKVICMLSFLKGGGLAEYAVASESLTVSRPAEVSAAEGAGLVVAAATALQALKLFGTKFDGTDQPRNLLITAASGGVGHYAVQLAKLGNFHVTVTCGARNSELVRSLGADEVLDYKTPDGASLRSPSGRKYDLVLHCTAGIDWSVFKPNLSPDGNVIDATPTVWSAFKYFLNKLTLPKQQLVPLMLMGNGEDLKFLIDLVKKGKVKTLVDSRYPFSRVKEAWAKIIEGHATGKIIVDMI